MLFYYSPKLQHCLLILYTKASMPYSVASTTVDWIDMFTYDTPHFKTKIFENHTYAVIHRQATYCEAELFCAQHTGGRLVARDLDIASKFSKSKGSRVENYFYDMAVLMVDSWSRDKKTPGWLFSWGSQGTDHPGKDRNFINRTESSIPNYLSLIHI